MYGLLIRCNVWKKQLYYRFPYGDRPRTVAKTIQRGTAPNRTVGFITAPNRTVRSAISETAPNRTAGLLISENRTELHRRIHESTEPHRCIYDF